MGVTEGAKFLDVVKVVQGHQRGGTDERQDYNNAVSGNTFAAGYGFSAALARVVREVRRTYALIQVRIAPVFGPGY